ncbi:MAG: cupin domain-containing protein [Oscillatoriales cyanobacterium C42_A2020_001]|nr:cupin domain-containing protein [Leptolyngbyaceae cyanobacterium C42_A2020_001]
MKELTSNHFNTAEKSNQPLTEVVVIRPEAEILTRQNLPYFVGVSANTAGAKKISMSIAVIPPGASAEPHFHPNHETAIYLIQGQVETRYGKGLKQSVVMEAGDFMFVPPGVLHQPRNLSATEPVYALVARNDANEQETTVLYDPTSEEL